MWKVNSSRSKPADKTSTSIWSTRSSASIHSIKGAAGFLGLTTVNKLSHSLENVLGKMRSRELVPTSFNVDVMLKAADALNKLFDDLESSNDVDVSDHVHGPRQDLCRRGG